MALSQLAFRILMLARFYALDYSTTVNPLSSSFVLSAGNEWAKQSKTLIFGDLNDISVEKLMVSILSLCFNLALHTDSPRHVSCFTTTRSA